MPRPKTLAQRQRANSRFFHARGTSVKRGTRAEAVRVIEEASTVTELKPLADLLNTTVKDLRTDNGKT